MIVACYCMSWFVLGYLFPFCNIQPLLFTLLAIISDDEGEAEKTELQTETKASEEESMTVPPPQDSDSEDEDVEKTSEV